MIDVKTAKEQIDFLAMVSQDTSVKYVARTKGGEYAGSCPICGGNDRFRVWPETKGFMCRGCGKKGDVITYLKEARGMSFKEAAEFIGVDSFAKAMTATPQRPQANVAPIPPAWAITGLSVAATFSSELWGPLGVIALNWLHDRGLRDETLQEFLLGWNRKAGTYEGLYIPRGWTIPGVAVDGTLYGLKVRKEQGEPKYPQVQDSQPCLMGRLTGKPTLLITEGEFDLMLAWQECRDVIDVATLGSAVNDPMPWAIHLLGYKQVLVCYDLDEQGEKGRAKWDNIPTVKHIRLPLTPSNTSKDITDFVRLGGNLMEWVKRFVEPEVPFVDQQFFCAVCGSAEIWKFGKYGKPVCEKHQEQANWAFWR